MTDHAKLELAITALLRLLGAVSVEGKRSDVYAIAIAGENCRAALEAEPGHHEHDPQAGRQDTRAPWDRVSKLTGKPIPQDSAPVDVATYPVEALRNAHMNGRREGHAKARGEIQEWADEDIAELFHATYERLAPSYGYETRKASAVQWMEVPERNRTLMIAVAREVRSALLAKLPEADRC